MNASILLDDKAKCIIEALLSKGSRVELIPVKNGVKNYTYQAGGDKRNPPQLGAGLGALVTSGAGGVVTAGTLLGPARSSAT